MRLFDSERRWLQEYGGVAVLSVILLGLLIWLGFTMMTNDGKVTTYTCNVPANTPGTYVCEKP